MNLRYLVLVILTIIIIGCGKNSSNDTSSSKAAQKAKSLLQYADSIALHRGFVGIHSHGKNIAYHAHQDPNKKRRIMNKQAKLAPIKISAAKKAGEARERRIKEILEEKKK